MSIGEVLNQASDWCRRARAVRAAERLHQVPAGTAARRRTRRHPDPRSSTVDETFRNQIGDLDFPAELPTADPASTCDFTAGPGFKWGYGLLLNTSDIPGMRRAWSGARAGLCNTQFWVDRSTGICGSIYSNFLPFVTPEAVKLYNDFERTLYTSL